LNSPGPYSNCAAARLASGYTAKGHGGQIAESANLMIFEEQQQYIMLFLAFKTFLERKNTVSEKFIKQIWQTLNKLFANFFQNYSLTSSRTVRVRFGLKT
jgi:hypothetical protein